LQALRLPRSRFRTPPPTRLVFRICPAIVRLLAAIVTTGLIGCGGAPSDAPSPAAVAAAVSAEGIFTDVATATGLESAYFNGAAGDFHLFEIMGGGAALLDYDRDGDLDAYLVQGAKIGPDGAIVQPHDGPPIRDQLYRNDLSVDDAGRRVLRFTDVTAASGIDARGYGMGVATGDFDNDGFVDLYVTNFGSNQLWRNNGDGTFRDVTEASGVDDSRWSVAAAFVDIDGDGWLDLYVGNYVDLTFSTSKACYATVRDYCSPNTYNAVPDRLFRNRGDGTFEDVTARSQLARSFGNGLGVVSADFNLDGRLDLYVANDGMANQCWINRGNGKFSETALLAGCAFNEYGDAEAGMGVSAADFDRDGDEDLFMTHLRGETNTLYVNDGTGLFTDETIGTGLGNPSVSHTGFGTSWFDYDNDGWLDLIVVNGAVTAIEALVRAGDPYPFHEPNQLYHNGGEGRFREVTAEAGDAFQQSEISRGAAFGDVDNDGDVDVLVVTVGAPARLLRNNVGNRNHWLGLRMSGRSVDRESPGCWVGVLRADGTQLWRRVRTEGSFASASDPRILVGLGSDPAPVEVRAVWPGGGIEQWTGQPTDQWIALREGTGQAVE
jgi:hypothetical protein